MAFVTKSNDRRGAQPAEPALPEVPPLDETAMDEAEDDEAQTVAERRKGDAPPKSAAVARRGAGFFTIYKKGQGYWTRMGTAIGIAVISGFTAYNLYTYVPTFLNRLPEATAARVGLIVGIVTLVTLVGLGWWLTNKPSNADFLIATDSEMKKVNWTSRRELIGSTKVVIVFMFFVTLFLFVVDIIFGYLFHLAHVLQNGPFGGS